MTRMTRITQMTQITQIVSAGRLGMVGLAIVLTASGVAAQSLRDRLLQAEDTRPVTDAQIAVFREAMTGNLRRTAIRAVGRTERTDLIPLVAPALADGVGVRA